MIKKNWISIFALTLIACKSIYEDKKVIGGFDISKDDKIILFSCHKNKESSIYITFNDTTKKIVSSTNSTDFYYPKYSADGEMIIFIGYDKGIVDKSALYISKPNGEMATKIFDDSSLVTEAFFSDSDKKIIFVKANNYGKYSPLGQEQAHGFDVYSFEIATKKVEKITNLNSYGIYKVSQLDSNIFIMQIADGEKGGMYLYSNILKKKIARIEPKNNPRNDNSLYYSPIFSKKYNLIAFTAPYELYTMDAEKKIAQRLFDNRGVSNIDEICFYNTQKRILFCFDGRLKSINLDNHEIKDITINL